MSLWMLHASLMHNDSILFLASRLALQRVAVSNEAS